MEVVGWLPEAPRPPPYVLLAGGDEHRFEDVEPDPHLIEERVRPAASAEGREAGRGRADEGALPAAGAEGHGVAVERPGRLEAHSPEHEGAPARVRPGVEVDV